MGWIKIRIPDNIENEFRQIAMKKFGYKKGALTKAIEEAIKDFVKKSK